MKVNRVISWYNKNNDDFVDEIQINNLDLNFLKKIFNPPEKDYLMYDSYKINAKEMDELSKVLNFNIDIEKFDYYVECFQADY